MQSEQINELMGALNRAQLNMKPASKDKVNPFFHSKYADLATVWEALAPFREQGIVLTQSPMESPDGYVILDTQLSHTVSGQWIRSRLKMRLAKEDPQGVGSAITYARRYALGCMTGIVTEEDDDGNAASPRPINEQLRVQKFTDSKQTAQAKIAELAKEMQEPARQELGGVAQAQVNLGSGPVSAVDQQGPDAAAPCFIWKMGKWKDTHIDDLPIDYLAWACGNVGREDHKKAAKDEIDRRQRQDVMAFEEQE